MNEVVADTERLLQRVIGDDVELATELGDGPLEVESDRGQLEQTLLNLAVNARDAMPGGGRLRIRTGRAGDPHGTAGGARDWISLTVTDNGIGMDAATSARAFEPFFTTKPEGKGTGLGPATVYGAVEQAGGHTMLDSEPGRGTTVTVLLPPGAPELERRHVQPELPHREPAGNETILLVEDEPSVRSLVAQSLRSLGYRLHEAPDGDAALTLASSLDTPVHALVTDLVMHALVTDLVMPGMNGPAVAETLRERWPELKVLYMSGYAHDALGGESVSQDWADFIQKPFSPMELGRRVRALLP